MRRQRSEGGPSFVGRNDAPPREPLPEEATPRTLRERVDKLRKDSRAMLAVLPRAFGLVWRADKGLTLALALTKGGLKVTVADPLAKASTLDEAFDGRVSALAYASVRMLQVLGVWPHLAAQAQPIDDILVTDAALGRAASAFSLHFDSREVGQPLGHIVENRHIRRG